MKHIVMITCIALSFSSLLFSCKKSDTTNSPNDTMSAQIGATSFAASGDNVHGLIETNPLDATKTELSVTAENGSKVLSVAVYDYKSATGTFSFDTGAAIGGYNSGSGGDDPIVSGSLIITNTSGNKIEGTFSGTTQGGISITTGNFTLNE